MGNQIFCPNCNKPVLDEEEICPNCGAILDIATDKTPLVSKALQYDEPSLSSTPSKPIMGQQPKSKQAQRKKTSFTSAAPKGNKAREKHSPNIRYKKNDDKTTTILIIVGAIAGIVILGYFLFVASGDTGSYVEPTYESKELDPIDMKFSISDTNFKMISNAKFWILTKGKLSRTECEEIRDKIVRDLTKPSKAISYLQSTKTFNEWRAAGAGVTLTFTESSFNYSGYLTLEFNIDF